MSITGDSKPRISKIVATNKFSVVEYFTEEDLLNAGHKVNNLLGKQTGAVVCLQDALGSVSLYVAAGPDPEDPWYRMAGGVSDAETEFQKSMTVNGDAKRYDKSVIEYVSDIPRTIDLGGGLYKFSPHNLIKTRRMSDRWSKLNNAQVEAGGDGRDWGVGGVSSCWIPDQIIYPGDTTAEFDIIVDTGSINVELRDPTGSYYTRATFGPGTHTGQKLYFDTPKNVQLFVYSTVPSSRFTMENIKVAAGKEVFEGGEDGRAYFEPRWFEDEFGGYMLLEDAQQNLLNPSCPTRSDFTSGSSTYYPWSYQSTGVSVSDTTGPDGRNNAVRISAQYYSFIWVNAHAVQSPGDNYSILASFTARLVSGEDSMYVNKSTSSSGLTSFKLTPEWKRFHIRLDGGYSADIINGFAMCPAQGNTTYEICDIQIIPCTRFGSVGQGYEYQPGLLRTSSQMTTKPQERLDFGDVSSTLLSSSLADPTSPPLYPTATGTLISKPTAWPLLGVVDVIGGDVITEGIIRGLPETKSGGQFGDWPQSDVYFMEGQRFRSTTKYSKDHPEVVALSWDLFQFTNPGGMAVLRGHKITEYLGDRLEEMPVVTNIAWNQNYNQFRGTTSIPKIKSYKFGSVVKLYNLSLYPRYEEYADLRDFCRTLIPVE